MRRSWPIAGVLLAASAWLSTGCRSMEYQADGGPAAVSDPTAPTEAQEEKLEQARAAQSSGDYDVALSLFQDILAENPMVTTAYIGTGEIYLAQKDYSRAEAAYGRAARLEPGSFKAQFGHGLALQLLDRVVEAIRAYQRALTIEPEDPRANLSMATAYLQIDEPESALAFARKSVEIDPFNGAARANLGAAYEKLGQNEPAINEYVAAMELMEPTSQLLMNLVNVLAKEKRYTEAVNAAETLVRLDPFANGYERLGWAYFRLNNPTKSMEAYRRAVDLDDGHWPSWNGIGINALNAWLISDRTNDDARLQARDALRRSLQINARQSKVLALMDRYNLR